MTYKVLATVNHKSLDKKNIKQFKSGALAVAVEKASNGNDFVKHIKSTFFSSTKNQVIAKTIDKAVKDVSSGNITHAWVECPNVKINKILFIKQPDNKAELRKWVEMFTRMVSLANAHNEKELSIHLNDSIISNPFGNLVEVAARTVESSSYKFNQTKNKTVKKLPLSKVTFTSFQLSASESRNTSAAVKKGYAIGEGMNATKFLGDLPANHCTPRIIESKAKQLKKIFPKLKIKSLNEKQLAQLKMGSYLSVARGSIEPPRMIIIEYNGGPKNVAPAVLVGKGVTFDTGGISLKPSGKMDEMKWDMGGAASVFGVMQTLARINAKVNVIGVMACAENMPSSKATKPGDVVTSMSGQTIEILNTDAEGRLVLCDALTYVKRYKPKYVIDIATLTGACVVALGQHASGLMSNDQKLADNILAAGENTFDRAWQLPLWDEYQSCTKTNFADLANIGGTGAGTITAACFLSRFAEDFRWAHLDIAGTAWVTSPKKGSTGRPVPLLTEMVLSSK